MRVSKTPGLEFPPGTPLLAQVFCALFASALACAPASAGQWRISPSVGVSTIASDNANAATDREDRNSDVIGTVSPGITVNGSGGRVSLDFAYTHERFESLQDTSDASATNTLLANGQAEIFDRTAFLAFNSSITRQVVDSRQPVSSVDTGSDNNRTTVRTASLRPFFLHHLGTWLETESRYRFDVSQSDSSEISKTRSNGETFTVNSGRRFSVFTFSGVLTRDTTIRGGDQPSTTQTDATTDYRLRVGPGFALLSSVGWQNVDDPTLEEEIRGLTWNVGFSAQPNSRSSIELTYGREFETDDINLSANYAPSARTNFTASYSQTLTTSEQILSDDLGFVVDNGFGTLIDSRTGLPFDPTNQNFDFENSLFRQQVLSVGFSASRRRNSYSGNLSWERREDESTEIESEVLSLSLSVSRTINSRLSASLSGTASLNDTGTADEREDKEFGLSASLTYLLMKNTNASLAYSTNRVRSNIGANNFHDNVVTLSLAHQF